MQYIDKTKKVDEKEKPAKEDWFKDSASSDEGEQRGGGSGAKQEAGSGDPYSCERVRPHYKHTSAEVGGCFRGSQRRGYFSSAGVTFG